MLTCKNASDLRAVAAQVPLERVLVEADCPSLSPVTVIPGRAFHSIQVGVRESRQVQS